MCWCPEVLRATRTPPIWSGGSRTPPIRKEVKTREAVLVRGSIELAREHWWRSVGMSGFARRRVSTQRGSSEHGSTREPKAVVCTLGTLNTDCGEAFSLLRFFVAVGQRNEVPPRTVANSDKKYSSHTTRANVGSTNPALTSTANDQPRAQNPARVRTKITWLIVIKNIAHIQPALTSAAATQH